MKKFVLKLFIFIVTLCISCIICYEIGVCISQHKQQSDVVYVWGDSQMNVGINLKSLSSLINYPTCSSATHGAGVYDFLVSIERMKPNKTCIISLPEFAWYRKPELDYNRTGLSISALKTLYDAGCSINLCLKILKDNRNLSSVYDTPFNMHHNLLDYYPELRYDWPLDKLCGLFNEPNEYSFWKQKAYVTGLNKLDKMGCKLVLVYFPVEKSLEDCARNSINRQKTHEVINELCSRYRLSTVNITLHSDSLLMYDLTHLNRIGANMVTDSIAKAIKSIDANMLIQINIDK